MARMITELQRTVASLQEKAERAERDRATVASVGVYQPPFYRLQSEEEEDKEIRDPIQ